MRPEYNMSNIFLGDFRQKNEIHAAEVVWDRDDTRLLGAFFQTPHDKMWRAKLFAVQGGTNPVETTNLFCTRNEAIDWIKAQEFQN